ncbi:hypothetical protein Salat_1135600 [Sesamum alatum]|uniref:Uncharacterized protein n=1 Tax=Sesamum alatum TaxID=300844 RepID=A0AAE2CN72_9LAMI|nr:hypothetical protein Salat_1135600 [Sesamum alatum]
MSDSFLAQIECVLETQNLIVAVFRMAGGTRWNEDLVKRVFRTQDATYILAISLEGGDDVLWSHYEKHGHFSVWSAYHLAYCEVSIGSRANGDLERQGVFTKGACPRCGLSKKTCSTPCFDILVPA